MVWNQTLLFYILHCFRYVPSACMFTRIPGKYSSVSAFFRNKKSFRAGLIQTKIPHISQDLCFEIVCVFHFFGNSVDSIKICFRLPVLTHSRTPCPPKRAVYTASLPCGRGFHRQCYCHHRGFTAPGSGMLQPLHFSCPIEMFNSDFQEVWTWNRSRRSRM